jgi:phosphatidylserine/phosphatidylglycerophosphate/cardiolipin synthase-like enzyme
MRTIGLYRRCKLTVLVCLTLCDLVQPATAGIPVASEGRLEVAFSPNGGGQALVLKTIAAARQEIHMLAYSFTSAQVTQALLAALKRGVIIQLVVDQNHNFSQDSSGKARAALSTLASGGADVRTTQAFAIHHDKVVIVDRRHVQLGSFNYSASAESRNSENVLVNWDNPALASIYLQHFTRNYAQSVAFRAGY